MFYTNCSVDFIFIKLNLQYCYPSYYKTNIIFISNYKPTFAKCVHNFVFIFYIYLLEVKKKNHTKQGSALHLDVSKKGLQN